tara:strand:- start:175 stop:819 length:645 start_codon:yes stop_codon:yes gene_type:complete
MINKKKIIIFGLGGGSRDVLGLIKDINTFDDQWELVGLVGKNNEMKGSTINGYNIIDFNDLPVSDDFYAIPSVTNPILKNKIYINQIKKLGYRLPILIHPNTFISEDFTPNPGSIIFSAVRISYNVKIGNLVWIDSNCNIGHNVEVGDNTSIMPMSLVLGNVGNDCFIGAGSLLHQKVNIGNNSLVGIGTTVIKDIPSNSKVINYPRNMISDNK